MEYTIKNGAMTATISDLGAQLLSVTKDGVEYLWNGDPKYWKGHAPILFPFVGRLFEDKYIYDGVTYEMSRHGFARGMTFAVEAQQENCIAMTIEDTEETRVMYPFRFLFRVVYSIEASALAMRIEVENRTDGKMIFGLGGHPAFMAPIEEGLSFEDYYLEFDHESIPDVIEKTEGVLLTGGAKPYPLEDGRKISLHHDLFDHDAVVLRNMPDTVTLKSDKGTRSVTVNYPGMPYIGFWHAVKTDAPYVAIEPWVTLPARDGIVEDFASRWDMIRLDKGGKYTNVVTITLQ